MAAALIWPGCLQSLSEEAVSELNKEEATDIWSAKSIPSRVVVAMCKGPVTAALAMLRTARTPLWIE